MIFVDTNVFLRFLLKDIAEQFEDAKKLFDNGAEGKSKLFTSTIVIFEINWVMTSFYSKDKKEICKILIDILNMNFVEIFERAVLLEAVTLLMVSNFSLEDSYNLAYAQARGAKEFKTFDKKLEKKFIRSLAT